MTSNRYGKEFFTEDLHWRGCMGRSALSCYLDGRWGDVTLLPKSADRPDVDLRRGYGLKGGYDALKSFIAEYYGLHDGAYCFAEDPLARPDDPWLQHDVCYHFAQGDNLMYWLDGDMDDVVHEETLLCSHNMMLMCIGSQPARVRPAIGQQVADSWVDTMLKCADYLVRSVFDEEGFAIIRLNS